MVKLVLRERGFSSPGANSDEVKQAIRDVMRTFTVGDPAKPNILVGPMVSQKHYERIESYIRKGAFKKAPGGAGRRRRPRRVSKQVTIVKLHGVRQRDE